MCMNIELQAPACFASKFSLIEIREVKVSCFFLLMFCCLIIKLDNKMYRFFGSTTGKSDVICGTLEI